MDRAENRLLKFVFFFAWKDSSERISERGMYDRAHIVELWTIRKKTRKVFVDTTPREYFPVVVPFLF